MHDSCINNANMVTSYTDKSWYQGSKNLNMICKYSSLPNTHGARNKQGGGKDEPFLINVVPGKSIEVRIFRPVTTIKRKKEMN